MNALIEQLSRQGTPYGIRRDGSIFILKDEWEFVEMGSGSPEPAHIADHKWIIIAGRWVLIELRTFEIAGALETTG